eukprot:COSAG02_NODE_37806_length_437_cov_0.911243_2_plen_59_part_01
MAIFNTRNAVTSGVAQLHAAIPGKVCPTVRKSGVGVRVWQNSASPGVVVACRRGGDAGS